MLKAFSLSTLKYNSPKKPLGGKEKGIIKVI